MIGNPPEQQDKRPERRRGTGPLTVSESWRKLLVEVNAVDGKQYVVNVSSAYQDSGQQHIEGGSDTTKLQIIIEIDGLGKIVLIPNGRHEFNMQETNDTNLLKSVADKVD